MTKQELRKLVECKTAEEQELLLDLLGEDRLLAIYGESFMLEIFTEANNARFARHIMNITGSKNVRFISYNDLVTDYDIYSFATLLAAEAKCKTYLRQYLADMTAQVCGNDVELVAECIVRWEDFLKEPQDTLKKIYKKSKRANGDEFKQELSAEDLNRRIWAAQVRNIFPELENYRMDFIERHRSDIDKLYTGDDPIELGNLYYYVRNWQINVSTEEKDELKTLPNSCIFPLYYILFI